MYGGTISAKKASHLAIPLRAEAHGRSPRTFNDLKLLPRGETLLLGLPRSNQQWEAFFVLKKKVTQPPDKTALPADSEMARHLTATLERLEL